METTAPIKTKEICCHRGVAPLCSRSLNLAMCHRHWPQQYKIILPTTSANGSQFSSPSTDKTPNRCPLRWQWSSRNGAVTGTHQTHNPARYRDEETRTKWRRTIRSEIFEGSHRPECPAKSWAQSKGNTSENHNLERTNHYQCSLTNVAPLSFAKPRSPETLLWWWAWFSIVLWTRPLPHNRLNLTDVCKVNSEAGFANVLVSGFHIPYHLLSLCR